MRQLETKGTFELDRGGVLRAKFIGLLPKTVASNYPMLSFNVIGDDIPILLGIEAIEKLKVKLGFPSVLMKTPEIFQVLQKSIWAYNLEYYKFLREVTGWDRRESWLLITRPCM